MTYAMRYKSAAKKELEQSCEDYGTGFRQEIDVWLKTIVLAETHGQSVAIDIATVIEEGLESHGRSWKLSWQKWWEASPRDKILAVYQIFKKWCPPWELKMAINWVTVIGRFDCEIHAYFIVDHVEKRVIFVKFDGLPGQE